MTETAEHNAFSMLPYRDQLSVGDGKLYIDGHCSPATGGATFKHIHPATNEAIVDIAMASAADVDRAVAAARHAFESGPWSRMAARDRARFVRHMADLLAAQGEDLGRVQTLDNGMPVGDSIKGPGSAAVSADIFDYYAGWSDKICGSVIPRYSAGGDQQFLTTREPVGVVAAIIPWNVPIRMLAQKVAPALAVGCTVVVKPSENASLSALRIAKLFESLDLPPGVFNVVTGGPETGEALARHPGVDKISFTGSRAVGERLVSISATGMKRLTLELGGKSPAIVFPDVADLKKTATSLMARCSMGLSGQVCSTTTRALVHASIYDDFISHARSQLSAVRFGDPFMPSTTSSAIITGRQLDKIAACIESGRQEGARLVEGGHRPGGIALAAGNFIEPALFADVDNRMTVAREEIFGPVLAIIPFSSEEEAIAMANDTDYGLSSAVFTADTPRAFRVAKALRAGSVGLNGYSVAPNAPLGGLKCSGIGRELGAEGLDAYLETKTLIMNFPGW